MILFGHSFIQSESFYHVSDIDSIIHTPPSSIIYLDFALENLDIIKHTKENVISIAINTTNITQVIYASALEAKYIIVPLHLAKDAQAIAQNYLFDAKILVHIENDSMLEELALLGIDGVIYSNAIIKISS